MRHSTSSLTKSPLQVAKLGPLSLESGQMLENVEIGYRTWGQPSNRAILVCHALTGSADAEDWWPGLFGPGLALDPDYDYIICSNVLGGCNGSSGPATASESLGRPWGPDFPEIQIRDMVRAQARLLESLGVDRLSLVIGGSMGGMQVLEWAALFPERVDAIAPIATSASHSAWCIGTSEAQRTAIRSDPRWCGGYYGRGTGPQDGLRVARMVAMQSYRTRESFELRFGRDIHEADDRFEVQRYLHYQGEKLTQRFDANSYLALTEAMDRHDIGRERGGIAQALASIDTPALVVGIDSDGLYPLEEQRELAERLPDAQFEIVPSPHGHDGFLIEDRTLEQLVRAFRCRLMAVQDRRCLTA